MLGLKTRCSRNKDGCKWEGELRHLYTHEKDECGWALVVCRYMCGASFPRSQLTEHEYYVCPRRPVDVKLESFMCKVEAKLALERDCHQKEIAAVKEQFTKILHDERESHRRELAVVRKEFTDVLDKERESRKRETATLRKELKSFCREEIKSVETGFVKVEKIQADKYVSFIQEVILDKEICKLTRDQVKALEKVASLKNVEIEIDCDPTLHQIKLHGCRTDVLYMKDKVREAVYKVRETLSKWEQEKVMLSAAKTVHQHIRWVRQLSDFDDYYDEVTNYEIEQAYQQKKPGYQCNINFESFAIVFKTMEETDLVTGDVVRVKRVDLAEG